MTLKIELPEDLHQYIQEQITKHGYRDVSEYFAAVLEAQQQRELGHEIEEMLLETSDGPFSDWTDDDVSDIERVGRRILERRKPR